jgi:hypothetical protein
MAYYRLAGQDFYFPCPVPELESFEIKATEHGTAEKAVPFVPHSFLKNESGASLHVPDCQTVGWVGGAQRLVEVYDTPSGMFMKVEGGNEFFIALHGETITKTDAQEELNQLDREIITGPALVLALALRGTWSLHASAATFKDNVIVFLGESGQGKSTLAAFLTASRDADWRLVADDILPVTMSSGRVNAWPRFPQLKLPMEAQPGPGLPEQIPLNRICVLTHADMDKMPELQLLPPGQSIQVLLRHTAGTRLFEPALLAKHLGFCGRAAEQIPVFRLTYPHRKDTLPKVKEYLESLC